jgi:hypothetical protein
VVLLLEILSRLPAGVCVHLHDIFLRHVDRSEWRERYYSEPCLLAALLLGRSRNVSVEPAVFFVSQDAALAALIQPLWTADMAGGQPTGGSF